MNEKVLDAWIKATGEHIEMISTIVKDRRLLKDMIEDHLSQFFDWDDIEYDRDFSEITLTFKDELVIKKDTSKLLMPFRIYGTYDKCIKVEVYPKGLIEGGG